MRPLAVLGSLVIILLLVASEIIAPGWRTPGQLVPSVRYAEWLLVLLYAAMALLVAWKAQRSREAHLIVAFLLALAIARGLYGVAAGMTGAIALALRFAGAAVVDVILFVAFFFPAVYPPRRTAASRWILRVGLFAVAMMIATWNLELTGTPLADIAHDAATFPFALAVIFAVVEGTIAGGATYRVQSLVAGSTIVLLALVDVFFVVADLVHWNPGWLSNVGILQYAAGAGMTYAILRHRLVDVHFVVSRAAIFSLFSLSLIALFAVAEWALIVIVEHAVGPRFGATEETALTAFVALGVGVSARSIHQAIEHRLNRVFFARRYQALAELHRYALETDATSDPIALVNLTVSMLRRNLDASVVGLYAGQPDAGYTLLLGDPALPAHLDTDEETVLRLRRWGEPFVVEIDEHPFAGAFVCPMALRRQLYGFIVCGRKRDRTSYLPDERETIASLVHRVGIAYEWLTREAPALRPAQSLA